MFNLEGEMKLANSFSFKANTTRLKKIKSKRLRLKRAFTLIELLVVIAIIGILAGVVVVNLGHARAKARDAKRISDLKGIQTAIEMYYDNNGHYPLCDGSTVCTTTGAEHSGNFTSLPLQDYLNNIPTDPKNINEQYGYYYAIPYLTNGNCGYTPGGDGYILATRLENPSIPSNSCPSGFGCWNNGSLNLLLGGRN